MPSRALLHDVWQFRLYLLATTAFWTLALGPGGGGTEDVTVYWTGAVVNFALVVPLARGAAWAAILLAVEGIVLAGVIASGGLPPWGPVFGYLAFLAAAQVLLLGALLNQQGELSNEKAQ